MAFRVNSFALLDGEESDDVSKILVRVAAKHVASSRPSTAERKLNNQKDQKEKPQNPSAQPQFPSKPLPPSEYVKVERGTGRGRGGRGKNSGRYNEVEQSRNNQKHGYQQNIGGENSSQRINGHSNGYWQDNGQADGFQMYARRANGYNQDNRRSNECVPEKKQADIVEQKNTDGFRVYYGKKASWGSESNGNQQAQGGRWGGRGRGVRLNGENGFRNDNQLQVHQQVDNQGQSGGFGGSQEKVNEGNLYKDESRTTNRSGGSGGERGNGRDYRGSRNQEGRSFARRGGMSNGKTAEVKISETKEQLDVKGDHKDNTNINATGGRSKDADPKQEKGQDVASQDQPRNRADKDNNKNKMTLEEYEKQLLEKRKALEALKTEERKVLLDKDFESMKLVDKRKEDAIFIKLDSEKDQLKKNDSSNKDEKVHKATSINEFLKPARREFYGRRGDRNQRGGGNDEGFSSPSVKVDDDHTPNFEDSKQFPALSASIRG